MHTGYRKTLWIKSSTKGHVFCVSFRRGEGRQYEDGIWDGGRNRGLVRADEKRKGGGGGEGWNPTE